MVDANMSISDGNQRSSTSCHLAFSSTATMLRVYIATELTIKHVTILTQTDTEGHPFL